MPATERLAAVFRNLLNTAVQHTDTDPPRTEVTCDHTDSAVQIHGADNDPGLAAAQTESLFEREQRGSASDRTGMGRYLVENLIQQFDGDSWTGDTTPAGTVVTVHHPFADHDPTQQ